MFYLTRTFEEIFTKYVNEDKIFVIKNSTTIINLSLPTLSQVIEEKKEEWRENDTYTNEKVSLFEEISKKLIEAVEEKDFWKVKSKEAIKFVERNYAWNRVSQSTIMSYGEIISSTE